MELSGIALAITVMVAVAYVLLAFVYTIVTWVKGVHGSTGKTISIVADIIGLAVLIGAATMYTFAGVLLVAIAVLSLIAITAWVEVGM